MTGLLRSTAEYLSCRCQCPEPVRFFTPLLYMLKRESNTYCQHFLGTAFFEDLVKIKGAVREVLCRPLQEVARILNIRFMQDTFITSEASVGGAIHVAEKTHSNAAPHRRTASLSTDGHRSTGSPRLPYTSKAKPRKCQSGTLPSAAPTKSYQALRPAIASARICGCDAAQGVYDQPYRSPAERLFLAHAALSTPSCASQTLSTSAVYLTYSSRLIAGQCYSAFPPEGI